MHDSLSSATHKWFSNGNASIHSACSMNPIIPRNNQIDALIGSPKQDYAFELRHQIGIHR